MLRRKSLHANASQAVSHSRSTLDANRKSLASAEVSVYGACKRAKCLQQVKIVDFERLV